MPLYQVSLSSKVSAPRKGFPSLLHNLCSVPTLCTECKFAPRSTLSLEIRLARLDSLKNGKSFSNFFSETQFSIEVDFACRFLFTLILFIVVVINVKMSCVIMHTFVYPPNCGERLLEMEYEREKRTD
jgi:hypothetical protein